MSDGESTDDILDAARDAGFDVDRRKVARWHRAGLLPAPAQVPLGYGRGTRSIYPEGTKAQLVRLCELKVRHRKHEVLAWRLWWEGWTIAPDKARSIAARVAGRWSSDWSALLTPDGGFTEEAEAALDRAHEAELPSHTLRQMRRRAGAEDFDFVLDALLRSMAGQPISEESAAALIHAMGLDEAQTDSLPGTEPWLAGEDPLEGIHVASQLMNPEAMSAAFAQMTDDQLRSATNTARGLVDTFDLLGGLLQPTLGRWALGFGLLTALAADARDDANGQIILTLFVHQLELAGLNENAADLIGSQEDLRISHKGLALVEDLAARLPEETVAMGARRVGKAMRKPAERAALEADIELLRERYPSEVAAALERQGLSSETAPPPT